MFLPLFLFRYSGRSLIPSHSPSLCTHNVLIVRGICFSLLLLHYERNKKDGGGRCDVFSPKEEEDSSRRNLYKRTDDSVCNVKSAAQIDKALAHCHCKREIVVDGHEMVVWTERRRVGQDWNCFLLVSQVTGATDVVKWRYQDKDTSCYVKFWFCFFLFPFFQLKDRDHRWLATCREG